MQKKCLNCNKIFYKKQTSSLREWSHAKFCSVDCHNQFRQGKPSPSFLTTFKKGHTLFSVDTRKKRYGTENNLWKGGMISLICKICDMDFQVIRTREKKAKTCSILCHREYRKTPEFRLAHSELLKKLFEEKNQGVRSHLTALDKIIRRSLQYAFWRESVFKRDGYKCQKCGNGGLLRADHIRQFGVILLEHNIQTFEQALQCKELWNVNNGQTLCDPCHKVTTTYGRRVLNNSTATYYEFSK